jgi:hypothetical protein
VTLARAAFCGRRRALWPLSPAVLKGRERRRVLSVHAHIQRSLLAGVPRVARGAQDRLSAKTDHLRPLYNSLFASLHVVVAHFAVDERFVGGVTDAHAILGETEIRHRFRKGQPRPSYMRLAGADDEESRSRKLICAALSNCRSKERPRRVPCRPLSLPPKAAGAAEGGFAFKVAMGRLLPGAALRGRVERAGRRRAGDSKQPADY